VLQFLSDCYDVTEFLPSGDVDVSQMQTTGTFSHVGTTSSLESIVLALGANKTVAVTYKESKD
jgi:hypothetical protein